MSSPPRGAALAHGVVDELSWDFDHDLQGWANATTGEMSVRVSQQGGKLRGSVELDAPSSNGRSTATGAQLDSPHVDSPQLCLTVSDRDRLVVRIAYMGLGLRVGRYPQSSLFVSSSSHIYVSRVELLAIGGARSSPRTVWLQRGRSADGKFAHVATFELPIVRKFAVAVSPVVNVLDGFAYAGCDGLAATMCRSKKSEMQGSPGLGLDELLGIMNDDDDTNRLSEQRSSTVTSNSGGYYVAATTTSSDYANANFAASTRTGRAARAEGDSSVAVTDFCVMTTMISLILLWRRVASTAVFANLLFAVGTAFAIARAGQARKSTQTLARRDAADGIQRRKLSRSPHVSPPKIFGAAVHTGLLLLMGLEVGSAQAATMCAGDATMMSATVLLCNEVTQMSTDGIVEVTGDVRLASLPADIAAVRFPNLAVIGQDLHVADVDATTTTISFPSLVSVKGLVYFNMVYSETVELPLLQNVSGGVYFYNFNSMSRISLKLSSLRNVGGVLSVIGYASVLDVSNLESVGSDFKLTYNFYLHTVNASALTTVGGHLYVYRCDDALTTLSFESLAHVGGYLKLSDNDALITAYFNSLTSVGSSGSIDCDASGSVVHVCVEDATSLKTIAFQSLDYGSVDIDISSGMCHALATIPHLRPYLPYTHAQTYQRHVTLRCLRNI